MTGTAEWTTGWEPGLPVDDSVLRRYVFSRADRLARMARAVGGPIAGSDQAAFADPGSGSLFDNGVVLLQPPTPALLETVMRQARTFFAPEHSWVLLSVWPTPDLSWRGLELIGHPPLLLRPPGGAGLPTAPPGLHVVEVGTPSTQADFEQVLATGWSMASGAPVVSPGLLGSVVRQFVGYQDGRPTAVAGGAPGHGMVELDWLTTLPEARNEGLGAVMAAEVLRAFPDQSAAVLATDRSRSLFERLGFVALLRATVWCRRTPLVPRARGDTA